MSKPYSLRDFTRRWLKPSKNPFENLRIGLSCYGLRDIWTLRNNAHHDERLFNISSNAYHNVRQLSSLLKGINGCTTSRRRAMMLLHLPYPGISTVHGRWRYWKPGIVGSTLNLYVPSETNIRVGSALFRSQSVKFQFAFSFLIDNPRNLERLIHTIDMAIQTGLSHNIEVKEVQCSHYHMMNAYNTNFRRREPIIRDLLRKYEDIAFRRIHTRINHAALTIAFSANPPCEFHSASHLPRPAYLCLIQDKARMHQFCMEPDDNSGGSPPLQTREANETENVTRDSQPTFYDDGNI